MAIPAIATPRAAATPATSGARRARAGAVARVRWPRAPRRARQRCVRGCWPWSLPGLGRLSVSPRPGSSVTVRALPIATRYSTGIAIARPRPGVGHVRCAEHHEQYRQHRADPGQGHHRTVEVAQPRPPAPPTPASRPATGSPRIRNPAPPAAGGDRRSRSPPLLAHRRAGLVRGPGPARARRPGWTTRSSTATSSARLPNPR